MGAPFRGKWTYAWGGSGLYLKENKIKKKQEEGEGSQVEERKTTTDGETGEPL